MAISLGQLGLLAEQRGRPAEALAWMVRCVALFDEFPHPSTGTGPEHLARLTAQLGIGALERCWREVTGNPLPPGGARLPPGGTTMNDDPVERIARAAALRLADRHGPTLPVEVEAALHNRGTTRPPDRYADPVSLAALLVSIATLAWTVHTDLRRQTRNPAPDVLARSIRVRLRDTGGLDPADRDRVIEVVVGETLP